MDGRRGRAKPSPYSFAVEPIRRRLEVWEDRVEFTVCELRDGNELPFPSAVPEQAVGRKPMDLQLETSRLVLRPLTLGDLGAVRALLIDPDVRRWMCDGLVLAEWRVPTFARSR